MKYRIGLGKDSHRFLTDEDLASNPEAAKKPLIIGGVHIPDQRPFKAHSDGDVLYHAVFNALSSSLGMSSIGHYFPDTSDEEKGRDSANYLQFISSQLKEVEGSIESMSIVVECKQPKIDPLSIPIKSHLAELLPLRLDDLSITATTGEGMTPWGQGLGVEVLCTVLVALGKS